MNERIRDNVRCQCARPIRLARRAGCRNDRALDEARPARSMRRPIGRAAGSDAPASSIEVEPTGSTLGRNTCMQIRPIRYVERRRAAHVASPCDGMRTAAHQPNAKRNRRA
ncbi:hypothetical protein WS71_12025 [Burkholderia mayonis]|uniref:Uncharacterized protein n=1 Tax=Burkholderia mayonis TaxID=1385591 RepID=A0A1B4FWA8_9BURK|nr:hypothetical protein WS71_12025 [Burkholderia mayonis]KVE55449.1 hypothetical protein WS71_03120 [Burkholderia mayonis]